MQSDAIWTLAGFILTLMVFSYLLGDNPLFRIATYLFIGVTAGYVSVLLIYQVILPRLLLPVVIGSATERTLVFFPLVMSMLLLFKLSGRLSGLGSISMAYLVGLGAAITVGGAVMGTIAGQVNASFHFLDDAPVSDASLALIEGLFILLGTISTLAYFHFGARPKPGQTIPQRPPVIQGLAGIGQLFIAVTLGSIFAGVLTTSVTALVERLVFLVRYLTALL